MEVSEEMIIFAARLGTNENIIMVRLYRNKEERVEAFKHSLGARKAFEDLVKGKISKSEFESLGYKLMQLA